MKKNYTWEAWGVIALVVIIIICLALWLSKQRSENGSGQTPANYNQQDNMHASTSPEQNGQGSSGSAKLSYGDAIKKYKYRIQFSQCHGNPGTIALKVNAPLMLDNRDDKTHTIKVASQTYTIKKYDYALAYISKAGVYNLTCDGGGAASVNIEK